MKSIKNVKEDNSLESNSKNEIKKFIFKNLFCFWSVSRSDESTETKTNQEANTNGWSEIKGNYID